MLSAQHLSVYKGKKKAQCICEVNQGYVAVGYAIDSAPYHFRETHVLHEVMRQADVNQESQSQRYKRGILCESEVSVSSTNYSGN